MQNKVSVFLQVILAVLMLNATGVYAQTSDGDLVKQGNDAIRHHEYDIAIARLSDAIRLAPEDNVAWSERGEAYARKGDYGRALADCNQALTLAPASSEAYRKRGNVYFLAEKFEQAIADYNTAIRLDPGDPLAYIDRGISYFHERQIDRAIADYDRAVRLGSPGSDIYALRGNAWLAKGNYDRAWDDFDKAIEVDPKNAYAYLCRGYAAARFYDYDQAIADYDEALRIDPNYSVVYRYREQARHSKNDIWWGKIYIALFGVGMLGILVGAVRAYRSRTAFSNVVERHFKRMPDGRLIFFPRLKGTGYVVPDTEREQALRGFARRARASTIIFGILGFALMLALVPLSSPVIGWLQSRAEISLTTSIYVCSFGLSAAIIVALFIAFLLWRREAVRGLVPVTEKGERPKQSQRLADILQDLPVALRWIAAAVTVFLFFESLWSLWRLATDPSYANLGPLPGFHWFMLGSSLFGLYFFGTVLVQIVPLLWPKHTP